MCNFQSCIGRQLALHIWESLERNSADSYKLYFQFWSEFFGNKQVNIYECISILMNNEGNQEQLEQGDMITL